MRVSFRVLVCEWSSGCVRSYCELRKPNLLGGHRVCVTAREYCCLHRLAHAAGCGHFFGRLHVEALALVGSAAVHVTVWLNTTQDGLKWDVMESDFMSSRLKQPARPTTPITTTTTTQPATDNQTTGTKRRRHKRRRRARRRRDATHFLKINGQLNLRYRCWL